MAGHLQLEFDQNIVVLLSDSVYEKTRRFTEKIREFTGSSSELILAVVNGFEAVLPLESALAYANEVLTGDITELAEKIQRKENEFGRNAIIIAMNQSAILPSLALRRVLNRPLLRGRFEACDKVLTRRMLMSSKDLKIDFSEIPREGIASTDISPTILPCVVKPTFGMSSCNVKICRNKNDIIRATRADPNAKSWVPEHVMRHIGTGTEFRSTDTRIVEPYIDGTEFSIDGWIFDDQFHAIVQHKLYMVERQFIGDGVTITPPIHLPSYLWANNG